MQNSDSDWEIQGSKIDQVYANCWLAIAADAAINCHAGFLNTSERQEFNIKTRKLVYYGPKGERNEFFIGIEGIWEPGWVWRTLCEVSWKCASASQCECQLRPHNKPPHRPEDVEEPRQIDTKNLKEFWREVIEQYNQRQLTYHSDRLAALAGLARRAHLASPDTEYYAGLWSNTLPSTLLWVVSWPVESGRECGYASHRIEPSIAPTWSWASVTGYVEFQFWKLAYDRGRWANSDPDLTDIDIRCPPSGRNKYGTVSDGKLTTVGYLCQVHISLTGGSRWHFPCKMESRKLGGMARKSLGYFYPDTDEILLETYVP
ncbi:hypothetical protein B0O99DRAFT_600530 [Bisporella sp. PMI_857]|nr:hypothetical protein B0O99DRAFT_600530 [Bisporella sp. PMI_857]